MYCTQCGVQNADEFSYCASCGAPLVAVAAPAAVATPVTKGNVAQAWADITGSPNWLKRLLLLMVMNCVPVLDLYVKGYNLQWGAEAARGNVEPLPTGSFTKKTLLFGLVPFLLGLLAVLGSVVLWVLALIPFIGVILVIACVYVGQAFLNMAVMRVGVTGKMSSAFDLSELFRACRTNLGSLLFASVIPNLLGAVVAGLFTLIVVAAAGGSLEAVVYSAYYYDYYYYYDPMGTASAMGALVVAIVVIALFAALVEGLVNLWAMRAVGYWVGKNAPEWVAEGVETENPFKAASAAPAVSAATVVEKPAE